MHLEASTKSHVHQKFQIFWTNIAFTMACPNFKNGSKSGLHPLGVKEHQWTKFILLTQLLTPSATYLKLDMYIFVRYIIQNCHLVHLEKIDAYVL